MLDMKTKTEDFAAQPDRDRVIRETQNGVIARMKARPEDAKSTLVTTGRIDDGLACTVEQGRFSTVTDLGRGMGGDASAPPPGFHARVAIVGCVGMAIKMLAAREGLVFRSVEVTVETDFDDSAIFGLGSSPAGPLETRVDIRVESDEDEATVRELVDRTLAMDPWYLALRDAQRVLPKLTVSGGADGRE
ncbi:OsmC family protein [Oricola thermophila]|uniref:OsmC family protein n=1 Tax=Oricola thermophila TaxID=2742145 RepID=A0A6N1VDR6_9HYPH|nr:OsmC family protein [Oricola thermophila]QKV17362.1 OsmC family protein [Oricola thermophila]